MTFSQPQVHNIDSSMVPTTRGLQKSEFRDPRDLERWAKFVASPTWDPSDLYIIFILKYPRGVQKIETPRNFQILLLHQLWRILGLLILVGNQEKFN